MKKNRIQTIEAAVDHIILRKLSYQQNLSKHTTRHGSIHFNCVMTTMKAKI